jgi:L-alanine-DL-glutamate epimerase-like enolase superfamily enzyme
VSDVWNRLAELPLKVESYELTDHDREYGDFTRPSTVIHLHGDGHVGIGEDVVYDVLDHIAHRDAGPVLDLTGPETLGQACALLGELDLFPGAPPEREPSRHYRRWAYESAMLDLALRQNGLSLWEVVERDPQPLRFVCSTRLGGFGEGAGKSTTGAIRKRLDKYPTLEFKLDPENDWDKALIDEIAGLAPVRVLDLKGHYRGTPVDVETDPELYRAVAEAFPDAYLEDPDLEPAAARKALEPHADRVTWDAPLHSLADVKEMARKAINSKPSRFGSLQELLAIYEYCEANGIAVYGGGQGEVECGRGQIQYLASLFHAGTPNDIAPSGYNDPTVPSGLPTSPMDPAQSETGFRWGN